MMQHYAINSYAIKLDMPHLRVIPKRRRDWLAIVHAVADAFEVSAADILGPSHKREVARPRQAAYLLIQRERKLGPTMIGRLMKRDHSTVIQGFASAEGYLKFDPDFAERYEEARRG